MDLLTYLLTYSLTTDQCFSSMGNFYPVKNIRKYLSRSKLKVRCHRNLITSMVLTYILMLHQFVIISCSLLVQTDVYRLKTVSALHVKYSHIVLYFHSGAAKH